MGPNIQFISHLDQFRWVAVCEHGRIHLAWNNQILFLSPAELSKLGFVLDVAITEDARFQQYQWAVEPDTEHWSVPSKGVFDVWIGRYAIRLSPFDYLMFGSMISKALDEVPSYLIREQSSIRIHVEEKTDKGETAIKDTPIRFSKN